MKFHLPSLLLGLLLGVVGASLTVQQLASRRLEAERSQVNQRIAAAVTEAEQTQAPAAPAPAPQAATAPAAPKSAHPFMNSNMMAQVSLFMRSQMETELAALKLRLHLNLTPEQEARLKAAVEDAMQRQTEMTQKMMSGEKLSADDLKGKGGKPVSWEKVLEEMLTPEQKVGYEAYKEEKTKTQREQMAQMQLSQVSSLLGLSEDQKDKVYSVLYENQDFSGMKDLPPEDVTASGIAKHMDDNLQKTREKLQGILSPEQLDLWTQQQKRQLELQRQMMERMMPAPKPDKL